MNAQIRQAIKLRVAKYSIFHVNNNGTLGAFRATQDNNAYIAKAILSRAKLRMKKAMEQK